MLSHGPNLGLTERIQRFTESARNVHLSTTIKDKICRLQLNCKDFKQHLNLQQRIRPVEAVWKAWVAKGRARGLRNSARRFNLLKLVSIVVLLTTAAFWSCLAPFDIVVRFIVAVGAVVVMLQTLHARNYASAAVFGALALLYQPGRTRIQFCRRLAALCNGCKRHTLPHFTRVAR
jgi:hypothetical protein